MAKHSGIPAVTDERDLAPTVKALVEAVELLTGQRGTGELKAVTKAEAKQIAQQAVEEAAGG